MQLLYMLSLHLPLVCLLCACSDLISSQHRQGKDRERINTRGTSVGIAIAKIPPTPKAANTKVPIAKGSQHYSKSHLSVSSLHPRSTETSSLSLQPQFLRKARRLFCLQTHLTLRTSCHGIPSFFRIFTQLLTFIGSLERSDRAESGISRTFEIK